MSKFIDEAVTLLSKSIIKLLKPWLIGYDKVEVIKMEKATTVVTLREHAYLEKRQYSFMIKSLILSLAISFITICYMPNLIANLVTCVLNEFVGQSRQTYDMHLQLRREWSLFSNFTLHIILLVYLNETFKYHTYGYNSIQKSLYKECKFNIRAIIVNILFFIADCYFIITQHTQKAYIIYSTLVLIVLLAYIFYVIKRKENLFRVTVRARGSQIGTGKCNIVNTTDDIDGENDINIICINEDKLNVNIFKENIHIVEDNNLLILGKDTNKIFFPYEIKQIDINNKMGMHIIVKFDSSLNKWVVC